MTASEAAPYVEIANNQRERFGFGVEMPSATGVTISTAESSGRKRKRGKTMKDPNAPKRATTAFFYFAHEERPKVREANPDFKVTDISKELGERWRAMSTEQKERFQELADKDKQRYKDEMKVFTDTTNKQQGQGVTASTEDAEEDWFLNRTTAPATSTSCVHISFLLFIVFSSFVSFDAGMLCCSNLIYLITIYLILFIFMLRSFFN